MTQASSQNHFLKYRLAIRLKGEVSGDCLYDLLYDTEQMAIDALYRLNEIWNATPPPYRPIYILESNRLAVNVNEIASISVEPYLVEAVKGAASAKVSSASENFQYSVEIGTERMDG